MTVPAADEQRVVDRSHATIQGTQAVDQVRRRAHTGLAALSDLWLSTDEPIPAWRCDAREGRKPAELKTNRA